jgi:two-component system sensor histidine kinase TctE
MVKPPQPSLRRQLLLHLAVPLLLVLMLAAAGGMVIARHVGYQVHDQWLLDSAMSLASQAKADGRRVTLALPPQVIEILEWDRVDRIYWQASSLRQGRLLGNAELPAPPAGMQPNQPRFYDAAIGGQPVRVVAVELPAPAGTGDTVRIELAETMHKREAVAERIFLQWAPLQLVVLILAGVFIWLAVTRNLRKVDSIAARLGTYETDSLTPIADVERMPVEVAPLIGAINGLLAKLSDERESQKRFISNAAHQLRTPLATLQVQTQRVLRERDPLRHGQALDDVHRAITRLNHVTHQLLMLMRSEPQAKKYIRLLPVDLAAKAYEAVERWTDAALDKGIDLGYEGPEQGVTVSGDGYLLLEMMGNLIDNAIRYSGPGHTVTLTLGAGPVSVAVDDDGPGIPEQERELVLERFYRGSSSEAAGGCGLGLPIAYEIAARHGARLTIGPGEGNRGTRVMVTFPGSG